MYKHIFANVSLHDFIKYNYLEFVCTRKTALDLPLNIKSSFFVKSDIKTTKLTLLFALLS